MPFIKFKHQNLTYKTKATDAIVSTDHIVKIVVDYFQRSADGTRWQTFVDEFGIEQMNDRIDRHFILFDVLGNAYDSLHTTEAGLRIIEEIWGSAE